MTYNYKTNDLQVRFKKRNLHIDTLDVSQTLTKNAGRFYYSIARVKENTLLLSSDSEAS